VLDHLVEGDGSVEDRLWTVRSSAWVQPEPDGERALRVEVHRRTLAPSDASAAPRLIVEVVLPTPPFWLTTATTLPGGQVERRGLRRHHLRRLDQRVLGQHLQRFRETSKTTSTSETAAGSGGVASTWAEAARLAGATGPATSPEAEGRHRQKSCWSSRAPPSL